MRFRAASEDDIQQAIIEAIGWQHPDVRVVHVPNGGKRPQRQNKRGQWFSPEGARLKRLGARAGFPDLILIWPERRVGFFEVKTPAGNLTKEQREWRDLLKGLGFPWALVRSSDDALLHMRQWRAA